MQSVIDERGRILLPQAVREDMGLSKGTILQLEQKGKSIVINTSKQQKKRRQTWSDLAGIKPKRTGKPKWPTPKEIKSIWE